MEVRQFGAGGSAPKNHDKGEYIDDVNLKHDSAIIKGSRDWTPVYERPVTVLYPAQVGEFRVE